MQRRTQLIIAAFALVALVVLFSDSTSQTFSSRFNDPLASARADPKYLEVLRNWRLQAFGAALRHDAREKANIAAEGPPPEKKEVYDTTEVYVECPGGNVELIGGPGDGSKWVCSLESFRAPCSVVSLGSGGDFKFETDIIKRTGCTVHTFDCTVDGHSIDARHTYHKLCLGTSKQAAASPLFVTLDDALRDLIRTPHIDLLKMDIEGFEWDVLSSWGVDASSRTMPLQLLLEVHSQELYLHTEYFNNPRAPLDTVIMYPPATVSTFAITNLMMHLNSLGFGIVNREINSINNQAMEFTLVNFVDPHKTH